MKPEKSYRQKNKQEREVEDAFYGGACAVLSLIDYGGSGTATEYVEAVGVLGAERLLAFARRNGDCELPRIRAAIRFRNSLSPLRRQRPSVKRGEA